MKNKTIKIGRIFLKVLGLIFIALAGYIAYKDHLFDAAFSICLGLGIIFFTLGQFGSDKLVDRILNLMSGWP